MLRKYLSRISAPGTARAMNRRLAPQVERLEERVVPVIGAAGDAPAVARGAAEYGGVVQIQVAEGGSGTGALVDTTRHILTAAHVIPAGRASTVLFELERDGRPVDIDIVVPAGAGFTTRHPDWNGRVADGKEPRRNKLPETGLSQLTV